MAMLYEDIRPKIRAGDLIAFSNESWGSKADFQSQLVRIFTRSEYSHVGVAWPIGGRVMLLEAVVPEIRIFPLSKLLPFYHLPVTGTAGEWTADVEEYALSRVGQKYSKLEAIKGLFGWTEAGNKRWQCAEYVLEVLRRAGLGIDCHATPTNLVREAMSLGAPLNMVTR
jgi:hypothetical protein